jgi:glycosyltransferase involved in cell wall biosynthesis
MMPAHNAAAYVRAAMESVRRQTYADWELIVVDDGSTDATAVHLSAPLDPRIRVLSQAAQGESVARNNALDHLRGEFVAFLDADDEWLPDHLQWTVAFLQAHAGMGGVYTDGFYIDGEGQRVASLASRRRGPFAGDLFEPLVRASDVFGPPGCVVLRREPIERRRLRFDPAIVIGPDWDFLTSYAETETFGYVDRPTLLYRIHDKSVSNRTPAPDRRLSLARCREKSIGRARFSSCRLDTRAYVFYDLLVELLPGDGPRRESILRLPEFERLPAAERGRLLRLMAAADLRRGAVDRHAGEWLLRARALDPRNLRNAVLAAAYAVNPGLCRLLLRLRSSSASG